MFREHRHNFFFTILNVLIIVLLFVVACAIVTFFTHCKFTFINLAGVNFVNILISENSDIQI